MVISKKLLTRIYEKDIKSFRASVSHYYCDKMFYTTYKFVDFYITKYILNYLKGKKLLVRTMRKS